MQIMPEVLFVAGIPPAYIEPFVMYLQYLEQLKTINNNTTDAQSNEIRDSLKNLTTTLQRLDFTSLSGVIDNDDNNEHEDSDEEEEDDDDDNNRRLSDDDDNEDDDESDDAARQPNWLFPKMLVTKQTKKQQHSNNTIRNF